MTCDASLIICAFRVKLTPSGTDCSHATFLAFPGIPARHPAWAAVFITRGGLADPNGRGTAALPGLSLFGYLSASHRQVAAADFPAPGSRCN